VLNWKKLIGLPDWLKASVYHAWAKKVSFLALYMVHYNIIIQSLWIGLHVLPGCCLSVVILWNLALMLLVSKARPGGPGYGSWPHLWSFFICETSCTIPFPPFFSIQKALNSLESPPPPSGSYNGVYMKSTCIWEGYFFCQNGIPKVSGFTSEQSLSAENLVEYHLHPRLELKHINT